MPPRKLAHQFAAVGNRCTKPVELLSIYPTLTEVCRLPGKPKQLEGHSLVPLLKDADANWPYFAITTHDGDNHAVRDDRYRYIRYADGSEELYDIDTDPNEWENLARDPKMKSVIARLAKAVPTNVADPPRPATKKSKN